MKQAGVYSIQLDKGAPNLFNNKEMIRNSIIQAKINRGASITQSIDFGKKQLNTSSTIVMNHPSLKQNSIGDY